MNYPKAWYALFAFCVLFAFGRLSAFGQQPFSELTGAISSQPVKNATEIPFLTWGGDVGFFLANGGLETTPNSIYGQMGLSIKLVNGDNFVAQTKRYIKGETPFVRGTMGMLGQASEVLGLNPNIKPAVFLQLTWSAGDHLVARNGMKSLNDLKPQGRKKRIAIQQGGPHVGMVYDAIAAAQLQKNDIDIVWCKDLSGDSGPAEVFKKDTTIDCCTVITPDMIGLTGGIDQIGSGAEGTVKGAKVIASTQQMSRSIADVLGARKDWYEVNKDVCERIEAGYFKACVQLVQMRGDFEKTKKLTPEYKAILEMTQAIFGKTVCPTLEIDTHGLLLDANFVGLTGNVAFFEDSGNLSGFNPKMKTALDMATSWGYARTRCGFDPGGLDFQKIAGMAGITYEAPKVTQRVVAESLNLFPDSNLDDRTLLSFTIYFEPEQPEFSVDRYSADFNRVIQGASTFGNAVVVVRGHCDPTKTLVDFLRAGMERGVIQRSGTKGNYAYSIEGQPFNLEQTKNVVRLIQEGTFTGATVNPRDTMQAAQLLSYSRAESVRKAIVDYAAAQKVNLDLSQIQPVGVGILEPFIAKPKNQEEARKNMRVEFCIIKVPAESLKPADFDY